MEEYVAAAIDAMPEPMLFKGTVGSSGATITYANTADAAYKNEGWTYKAITAGTVNTNTAVAAGDTIIYNGSAWVVIPSGDEPSGTVTTVTPGSGLTTTNLPPTDTDGDPITSYGTISISDNYRSCHETGTIVASNNGSSPASFTPLPIITSLTDGSIREVHLYNSSGTEIGADIRISGTGLSTGEFEISAILPASYSDTWTWVATCW
jgi:hypothetical protein